MAAKVLMYHGFGRRPKRADPHNLFVPLEDFERHLRFLVRFFRPLTLDEYIAGGRAGRWPRRSVLVTIDDGYVSTIEEAAPLLAQYGVPAAVYVCPGRFGGVSSWGPGATERLMSAPQVAELSAYGLDVGVHGMDHRPLPGLAPEELNEQVVVAREQLANVIGRLPSSFAYPEGLWDEAARLAVRETGYEVAFSVGEGDGRFAVTRLPITALDSFVTFVAKTLPFFEGLERAATEHPRLRRLAARLLGQRSRVAR